MRISKYIKNHWSSLLLIVAVVLLIVPQTAMPIKVMVQRLISFSPSIISEEKREQLNDYDWSMISTEGETIDLADTKGRVILINVWATWCPPCVAEMPSFQRLYDLYGDQVAFYFVSTENIDKLSRFKAKYEYSMPVYQMSQSPPEVLTTYSFPTTYLIDKHGNIVIEKKGAAKWDSESVKDLIDRLISE